MDDIDVKSTLLQYWDHGKDITPEEMRIVQEQNFAEKGGEAKEKMIEMSKVDEIHGGNGVFILHGDYLSTQNAAHYNRYKIKYVINAYSHTAPRGENSITYPVTLGSVLNIQIPNNLGDMKKISPVVIGFIKMAMAMSNSVLIYCMDGSPYSLVAILLFLYDVKFNTAKALDFLGKKIPNFTADSLIDFKWLLEAHQ
nr:hypothetical protein K-LCC10_0164 [Kaumoebavirus]